MKPKKSIKGRKLILISATPPAKTRSVIFIANSIETIDKKLIPKAVEKAFLKSRLFAINIPVSKQTLVINPLIMARAMIKIGDQFQSNIWNK